MTTEYSITDIERTVEFTKFLVTEMDDYISILVDVLYTIGSGELAGDGHTKLSDLIRRMATTRKYINNTSDSTQSLLLNRVCDLLKENSDE